MDQMTTIKAELAQITGLFQEKKELRAIFMVVKGKKRGCMLAQDVIDFDKHLASLLMKQLTQTYKPDFVVYASECWAVWMERNTKQPSPDITPSKHPDRKEMVFVAIEFKTGEQYLCDADIKRDKFKVTLGEFSIRPAQGSEGRFANFYQHDTTVN
jgi:hypothetical protein